MRHWSSGLGQFDNGHVNRLRRIYYGLGISMSFLPHRYKLLIYTCDSSMKYTEATIILALFITIRDFSDESLKPHYGFWRRLAVIRVLYSSGRLLDIV
jgi:hypothetical protein